MTCTLAPNNFVVPLKILLHTPVVRSHILMVLSLLPLNSVELSINFRHITRTIKNKSLVKKTYVVVPT